MTRLGVDYSITSPAICLLEDDKATMVCFGKKRKTIETLAFGGQRLIFEILPRREFANDQVRYHELANDLADHIPLHLKTGRIEAYAFGASGRVFNIAEATQTFKYTLWLRQGLLFDTVAPTSLKKEATGNGRGDKNLMAEAFHGVTGVWAHEILDCKILANPATDVVDSFFVAGGVSWAK